MKLNPELQDILQKHFGDEMKNLQEQAVIFSAYQLSDEEKQAILSKFHQIHGKKILNIVDKSLIGGFILTYGSKMIDVSIRGALLDLQNKLYEE